MGAIKDIVDLAKDLESSVKERKDLETLRKIHALANEIQEKQVEVMERDLRLMEENAELKRRLDERDSEKILIKHGIEFRNGKRTGDEWLPFCPSCHMPVEYFDQANFVECTKKCGWNVQLASTTMPMLLADLQ